MILIERINEKRERFTKQLDRILSRITLGKSVNTIKNQIIEDVRLFVVDTIDKDVFEAVINEADNFCRDKASFLSLRHRYNNNENDGILMQKELNLRLFIKDFDVFIAIADFDKYFEEFQEGLVNTVKKIARFYNIPVSSTVDKNNYSIKVNVTVSQFARVILSSYLSAIDKCLSLFYKENQKFKISLDHAKKQTTDFFITPSNYYFYIEGQESYLIHPKHTKLVDEKYAVGRLIWKYDSIKIKYTNSDDYKNKRGRFSNTFSFKNTKSIKENLIEFEAIISNIINN